MSSFAGGFAGGVIGTLSVQIIADTTGLDKGLSAAEKGLAGLAVGGFAVAAKSAIDFESSFAGVRKTVDGTPAELNAIATGFRSMAKEIPVNVNGLNEIGEAAGALGVKRENIVGFTRVVADLGVSSNLAGEQGATMLARFANITQMPQSEYERLGSTIVALGNNGASTEAEIAELGLRLAGAGHQAGLSEPEILGFANALSSLGINAEAGGTAFSRVMIEIGNAVAEGGDAITAFSDVAGVSADEFAAKWKADPAEALIMFIEGLARLDAQGVNTNAVLDELGLDGIRVGDTLRRLAGSGDMMRESVEMGTEAWKENTALAKEAGERYKTTASQIQIAKNNVNDLAISAGTQLLPAIVGVTQGVVSLTDAFGALPDSSQNFIMLTAAAAALTPVAIKAAGAVLGLATNLQTAGFALAHPSLLTGPQKVGLALGGLTLAVGALDLALQESTGKGLFARLNDLLADNEERTKGATDGLRELEIAMKAVGETEVTPDRIIDLLDSVEKGITDASAAVQQHGPMIADLMGGLGTEYEEAKGKVDAWGKSLVDSGADAEEIVRVYQSIADDGLRGVFAAAVDLDKQQAILNARQRESQAAFEEDIRTLKETRTAYEEVKKPLVNLPGIIDGVNRVMEVAAEVNTEAGGTYVGLGDDIRTFTTRVGDTTYIVQSTSGPFATFIQYLKDSGVEVETLDDAISELNSRIGEMASRFAEANPAMATLRLQEAQLRDEKAELIAAYGTENEAINERIAAIDEELKVNGQRQEAMRTDQALISAAVDVIGKYAVGQEDAETAVLNLVNTMQASGRTLQEQENFVNKLAVGWQAMATGDLPTAISMFGDLKAELSPQEWGAIASALGPEFIHAIQSGIADPAQQATVLETVANLGLATNEEMARALGEGRPADEFIAAVSAGISDPGKQADVLTAAAALGIITTEELATALGDGAPAVTDAATTTVTDGVDGATDAAAEAGSGLGSAAADGAATALEDADLSGPAGKAADTIAGAGDNAEKAGEDIGARGPVGIAHGLMSGVNGIIGAARDAASSMGDASPEAEGAGSDIGGAFGGAIPVGLDQQRNAILMGISQMVGLMKLQQSFAAEGGLAVGGSFSQGIAAGIAGGASAIIGAAVGVATAALGAAKAALQIHSPSLTMANEVGKPIIEGIIVGMQSMIPQLREETGAIGEAFVEELQRKNWLATVRDVFGDGGADAMDAFLDALVDRSASSEKSFLNSLDAWLEDAGLAGTAMGEQIRQAALTALSGMPEDIAAFLAALPGIVPADLGSQFAQSIANAEFHDALVERFGEATADALEALHATIVEGGPDMAGAVGEMAVEAAKTAGIWGTKAGDEWLEKVNAAVAAGDFTGVEILFAEAYGEAPTLAEGFAEAVGGEQFRQYLVANFGEAMAESILAMEDAMASGDGAAVLDTVKQIMADAGIDWGSATGQAIIDGVGQILADGGSWKDVVNFLAENGALVEAGEYAGMTVADALLSGYETTMLDEDRLERMGSAGKALFDAITAAGDEWSAEEAGRIGELAARWESDLAEKLGPETARALMKPFWDAVAQATAEGRVLTEEEIDALFTGINETAEEKLEILDGILDGLPSDLKDALAEANDGTITWESLWDSLNEIAETGVVEIDGKMVRLSEGMQARLVELLTLYQQGLLDAEEFVDAVNAIYADIERPSELPDTRVTAMGGRQLAGMSEEDRAAINWRLSTRNGGTGPQAGDIVERRSDGSTVITQSVRMRSDDELRGMLAGLASGDNADVAAAQRAISGLNSADRRRLNELNPGTGGDLRIGSSNMTPQEIRDLREEQARQREREGGGTANQGTGRNLLTEAWESMLAPGGAMGNTMTQAMDRAMSGTFSGLGSLFGGLFGGGSGRGSAPVPVAVTGMTVNGDFVMQLPSSADSDPQTYARIAHDEFVRLLDQMFGPDALAHGVTGGSA